jgi:hypothetical protein
MTNIDERQMARGRIQNTFLIVTYNKWAE